MGSTLIFAFMRTRDEQKIESVYKEALKMIVKEGFEGFSMQKLARAAGVSPATIYIYFKDKEDLLLQLYRKVKEEYFEYIMKGFDPEMNFATGLEVQWRNRSQYLIKRPDVGHFMENLTFSPLWKRALSEGDARFPETMKLFVKNAVRNKELASMPGEVFWSAAFAPLYNLIRHHKAGVNHSGEKFTLTDEILLQTLSFVLKGLRP